jgi:hypothetical protein
LPARKGPLVGWRQCRTRSRCAARGHDVRGAKVRKFSPAIESW